MKYLFKSLLIVPQILFLLIIVPVAFSDTNVGGSITSSTTWTADNSPYVVTSTVLVYQSARLTIEPGVTVKFNAGTALWIGDPSNDGSSAFRGSLTADGTAVSQITFTSANGLSGGWQGIIFGPRSDDYSSSSMQHCIIEKAGETNFLDEQANVHLYYTGSGDAIVISQVEIKESTGAGLFSSYSSVNLSGSTLSGNDSHAVYAESSALTITDTTVSGNGSHGYYISDCTGTVDGGSVSGNNSHGVRVEDDTSVTFSNITIDNNTGYGVYCDDFQPYITIHDNAFNHNADYPARISAQCAMYENTFSNSQKSGIEMVGGALTDRPARWYLPGTGDHHPYIHENITTVTNSRYLTVDPGVIVQFKNGSGLEIAHFSNDASSIYRGGLLVNGTADDPVVFTSYSGEPGGWRGVIFGPRSDDSMTSVINCLTIEKAGEKNSNDISSNLMMYYAGGNSTEFADCNFNESTGHGVFSSYSNFELSGGGASDNTGSGFYNDHATFNGNGLTVSDNQDNGIDGHNSDGTITGCAITNSGDYAVYLDASSMTVTDNTLSQNGNYAVFYTIENANPVIRDNTLSQNMHPGIQIRGGTIATDHTLYAQAGEPFFTVTDENLSVWNSRQLTVDPGVTLKFSSGLGLWIGHPSNDGSSSYRGSLAANGTLDSKIVFTSAGDDSGRWQGIIFGPGSDDYTTSSMQYCIIENGGETNYLGVQANVHLNYAGSGFVFDHIVIGNSSNIGLYLHYSTFNSNHLHVFNNGSDGVFYDASSGNITDSIIVNNTAAGIKIADSVLSVSSSYIVNNDYGLYLSNSASSAINSNIISANTSYGLYAEASITPVNAANNFWGDATGPCDASDDLSAGGEYNPDGTGDPVSDYAAYVPWTGSVTDSDGDGLPDFVEALAGTDPYDEDTDDDGQSDAWEIQNGLNPLDDLSEDNSDDQDQDGNDNGESSDGSDSSGGGCFINTSAWITDNLFFSIHSTIHKHPFAFILPISIAKDTGTPQHLPKSTRTDTFWDTYPKTFLKVPDRGLF